MLLVSAQYHGGVSWNRFLRRNLFLIGRDKSSDDIIRGKNRQHLEILRASFSHQHHWIKSKESFARRLCNHITIGFRCTRSLIAEFLQHLNRWAFSSASNTLYRRKVRVLFLKDWDQTLSAWHRQELCTFVPTVRPKKRWAIAGKCTAWIFFSKFVIIKPFVCRFLPTDSPFSHILSASCAGFVSSTATNPIWFVKTRLQLDHDSNSKMNVRQTIKRIYETNGLRGFYKGITASYFGISETVVHFVIYEALKKKLVRFIDNIWCLNFLTHIVLGWVAWKATRRRQNNSRLCRVYACRCHFEDDRFMHRLSSWSRSHKIARRGQQIQQILADALPRVEGRRQSRALSWTRHTTRPTNSKYRHNDGDLRGCCVCFIDEVQRNILFGWSSQWEFEWKESVAWTSSDNLVLIDSLLNLELP